MTKVLTRPTQEMADEALRVNDTDDFRGGWKHIGSGTTRRVYLGPDGWVYKIGAHYNGIEWRSYQFLLDKKLPAGWRLPETHLFGEVIAMEYVKGDISREEYEQIDGYYRQWLKLGIRDAWEYNVKRDPDGTFVLIDIGASDY